MQDPMEVYIDDEAKLTLHGLQQHYVKLKDSEKNTPDAKKGKFGSSKLV